MTQWMVMYKKEMLEMWRGFKWLWLPIVFVILGLMQPVTTYYMPQILEAAGGLPEGAVIEIPTPTGGQMMAEVISQYGTLGVLLLALAGMGIVAGEKLSRSVSLVMVRPVSHASFISAKWAAFASLGLTSYIAGSLAGWYYTEILIGKVPVSDGLKALCVYGLWLLFVMTVTVMMSTLLKSNGGIAFSSIIVVAVLSLVTGLLDRWMLWSPARLSGHAANLLGNGAVGDQFMLSLVVAILFIIAMLVATVMVFRRQELAD